jgi:hypothetical protein
MPDITAQISKTFLIVFTKRMQKPGRASRLNYRKGALGKTKLLRIIKPQLFPGAFIWQLGTTCGGK